MLSSVALQAIIDGQRTNSNDHDNFISIIRKLFNQNKPSDPAQGIQNQYLAPYNITSFSFRPKLRLNTIDNLFYNKLIIENIYKMPQLWTVICLIKIPKIC